MVRWTLMALLVALSVGCGKSESGAKPPGEAPQLEQVAATPAAQKALSELDREIESHRGKIAEATGDLDTPEVVARSLAARVVLDQFIRTFEPRFESAVDRFSFNQQASTRWLEVDQANTRALQAIIDRHGWPTISRFGVGASEDAWLLAQHADQDVAFQKRVLALMEPLVSSGEVSAQNVAYLWDRVATAEKRLQRYGTQGQCTGPGTWEPLPIEDPEGVDVRRAEADMGSLAEYISMFVDMCR